MARPKKDDSKSDEAPASAPAHTISIAQFMHTRDSVVTGLTTLQQSVGILLQSYIDYTNRILAGNSLDGLNLRAITNPLNAAGSIGGINQTEAEGNAKPKRPPKKERDANAPRRPLTAFFLYLQHVRPIVRDSLGPVATRGQVAEEATRRWSELTEEEKNVWKARYHANYEAFKQMKKEYETTGSFTVPSWYQQDIIEPELEDVIASVPAETSTSTSEESSSEDDTDSEPATSRAARPPKEPTPPAKPLQSDAPKSSKRRKTDKDAAGTTEVTGAAASSTSKTTISPVPAGAAAKSSPDQLPGTDDRHASKERSPEKKKKKSRKSKGGAEGEKAAETVEDAQPTSPPVTVAETDKSEKEKAEKKRSKKRKSEAAA